jgi:hypothetical protein
MNRKIAAEVSAERAKIAAIAIDTTMASSVPNVRMSVGPGGGASALGCSVWWSSGTRDDSRLHVRAAPRLGGEQVLEARLLHGQVRVERACEQRGDVGEAAVAGEEMRDRCLVRTGERSRRGVIAPSRLEGEGERGKRSASTGAKCSAPRAARSSGGIGGAASRSG